MMPILVRDIRHAITAYNADRGRVRKHVSGNQRDIHALEQLETKYLKALDLESDLDPKIKHPVSPLASFELTKILANPNITPGHLSYDLITPLINKFGHANILLAVKILKQNNTACSYENYQLVLEHPNPVSMAQAIYTLDQQSRPLEIYLAELQRTNDPDRFLQNKNALEDILQLLRSNPSTNKPKLLHEVELCENLEFLAPAIWTLHDNNLLTEFNVTKLKEAKYPTLLAQALLFVKDYDYDEKNKILVAGKLIDVFMSTEFAVDFTLDLLNKPALRWFYGYLPMVDLGTELTSFHNKVRALKNSAASEKPINAPSKWQQFSNGFYSFAANAVSAIGYKPADSTYNPTVFATPRPTPDEDKEDVEITCNGRRLNSLPTTP